VITGFILLAANVSSISRAEETAAADDWQNDVELMGWTIAGASDDTVLLVRPAAQTPSSPYRLIWTRHEYAGPQDWGLGFKVMSATVLEEVDCKERKSRRLQAAYFSKRNLSGERDTSPSLSPSWRPAQEGTIGDDKIVAACAKPLPKGRR
jgi:hypothetical protein